MTDKELLELAAKAAGLDLTPMEVKNVEFKGDDHFIGFMTNIEQWPRRWFNPLENDADAIQLAAKLELEVSFGQCGAVIYMKGGIKIEEISDDYMPATRRAIVRAAAQLA